MLFRSVRTMLADEPTLQRSKYRDFLSSIRSANVSHFDGLCDDHTRFLILGALVAVWSVVNANAKHDRIEGETTDYIDVKITRLKGFAAAMVKAGWLTVSKKPKSLTFTDFHLWNKTMHDREKPPPMTPAERQAKSRANKRCHENVTDKNVTVTNACHDSVTPCHDRVEKSREEKRTEEEKEGERAASGDPPAKSKKPIAITAEAFAQVWRDAGHDGHVIQAATEFHAHRLAMRKPITQLAATKLVAQCKGFTSVEIIADIERAIASGYQGLRPTKTFNKPDKSAGTNASLMADIAAQRARIEKYL